MPHGETGESSVDLIPFQVTDVLDRASHFEFSNLKRLRFILLVDYSVFRDTLC